jgi:hypothetical protein
MPEKRAEKERWILTGYMYLRSVHLFTTTTARTVEVKAIAVSSRPISLNFRAIEEFHLQQFLELLYLTFNYLKSIHWPYVPKDGQYE